jgi:hypothetical protein
MSSSKTTAEKINLHPLSTSLALTTDLATPTLEENFFTIVRALDHTYGGEIDIEIDRHQFVFEAAATTVVVKSDVAGSQVLFYADIGLPASFDQLEIYRAALEDNLARTYQSVIVGVHGGSERMVATAALTQQDMINANSPEMASHEIMEGLFECVHGMRTRFSFFNK